MFPFAFLVTAVKTVLQNSPQRHQSWTVTNGEQMFLGCQNGSFLLDTWALGCREWVTVRPWRPDRLPRVSGTAGQPSPVKLGNSGLLTALGMRVCALNEELGPALTSQQAHSSVYKDLVPQGLGGRAQRRICFSQDLGASAAILCHPLSHITSLAHFPLPRNPTRPAPGDGRWEWTRGNGQAACSSQRSPPHPVSGLQWQQPPTGHPMVLLQ